MKPFSFLLSTLLLLLLTACSTYESKDLYGTWHCEEFDFTFGEDKSMSLRRGDIKESGRYKPFGNAIELIGENELVITRVTINYIKGDSMKIDMPVGGSSRHFVLTKVN
jgi:hypothetical protein